MRFLNRALLVLDRIYLFDGGQSGVNEMDLSRPITLVHNVSREAEVGSGIGKANGWFAFLATIVHAAPGALQTLFDIQAAAVATGLYDPDRHDIWLFDTAVPLAAAGVFTSGFELTSAEPLQAQNTSRLWRRWTGELVRAVGSAVAIPTYEYNRPIPLYFPSSMIIETTAALAGTVLVNHICWIGAKGSMPPHVA